MSDYIKIGEWNFVPSKDITAEMTAKYEDALNDAEVSIKVVMNLCVVFDEIYANICNHSGATEMSLTIYKNDSSVKIEFIDNGIMFDPTKHVETDITKSAEEREIGGLGILMVRKMTDSMAYEYRDDRNCLTLIKNC